MIGRLRSLFWLGILMLFVPFLGIPDTWKMILAMLVGIILIVIAITLRKQYRAMRSIIKNLEHTISDYTITHPSPESVINHE